MSRLNSRSKDASIVLGLSKEIRYDLLCVETMPLKDLLLLNSSHTGSEPKILASSPEDTFKNENFPLKRKTEVKNLLIF